MAQLTIWMMYPEVPDGPIVKAKNAPRAAPIAVPTTLASAMITTIFPITRASPAVSSTMLGSASAMSPLLMSRAS